MTPLARTEAARASAARRSSGGLRTPLGLVALGAIPAIAGALRLLELAGGPPVLPLNPRIAASPAPAVIHVASAIPYLLVGAFQFSSALRSRWPRWHLRAGKVLLVLGLAVSLSALWMTLVYPREAGTGALHYIFRLMFGSAMTVCLVLGMVTVRRRDFAGHRAWMMRAYALAAGAGTQVFTQGISETVFGTSELSSGLALGAGWVINLTVAEALIARTKRAPARARLVLERSLMSQPPEPYLPAHYQFRISEQLDPHWSAWFDGFAVFQEDDGTTTLTGPVQDQAQLHGLLGRIRDLGVTLISVQVEPVGPISED